MIIALLLIAFVLLYQPVARVIVRRRLLGQLCREIHRAGGKIQRLRRFPSLSGNCQKRPELLVRLEGVQYVVKLWSPWHRNADLFVGSDGRVCEVRALEAPLAPHGARRSRAVRGLRYRVPKSEVRARLPRTVRQENLLLIAPSYRRILRREGGKWREVSEGDTLFGKTLITPDSFLNLIYKNKGGQGT